MFITPIVVSELPPIKRGRNQEMNFQEDSLIRLTREEASKSLRMSLATLDKRISEGALSVVRDGKRIFILQDELNRYLRGE
jgi:excisionase family DNA binding protein